MREELETLRANPDSTPHPAALQVPELTLALRKLSDKLTATEETLLTRTAELLHTREALSQAHHDSSAARELANQARAREEAAKERERQMALRAKAAEEERKMTDFVVQEYADLVRSLQGQGHSHSRNPSATSQNGGSEEVSAPPTPADSLVEGRSGLQRLLSEFNGESEKLTSELHRMQGDIDSLTASLEVERKSSEEIRSQLAEALVQLDKCKADDTTATKMVSRYMSVLLTVFLCALLNFLHLVGNSRNLQQMHYRRRWIPYASDILPPLALSTLRSNSFRKISSRNVEKQKLYVAPWTSFLKTSPENHMVVAEKYRSDYRSSVVKKTWQSISDDGFESPGNSSQEHLALALAIPILLSSLHAGKLSRAQKVSWRH